MLHIASTPEGTKFYGSADHKHEFGILVGNTLVKKCRYEKHFLHTPEAISLDADMLDYCREQGVTEVIADAPCRRTRYRAPLSAFYERGVEMSRKFGRQRFLILSDWQTEPLPKREHQRTTPLLSRLLAA